MSTVNMPLVNPLAFLSMGGGGGGGGGMDPLVLATLIGGGLSLGGGLLQGIGQGKQNEAQIAAQERMQGRNLQLTRDVQGLQATQLDPFAWQKARQNQAILAAVMPGLRNASVTSNVPGMNRFIPQVQGGLRFPEGGFGPETLQHFSPEARAAAEQEFQGRVGQVAGGAPQGPMTGRPGPSGPPNARMRNAAMMGALR